MTGRPQNLTRSRTGTSSARTGEPKGTVSQAWATTYSSVSPLTGAGTNQRVRRHTTSTNCRRTSRDHCCTKSANAQGRSTGKKTGANLNSLWSPSARDGAAGSSTLRPTGCGSRWTHALSAACRPRGPKGFRPRTQVTVDGVSTNCSGPFRECSVLHSLCRDGLR